MAKSGPESPRPAQQRVAEPAGGKNSFDGEESTEVMDVPVVPAKASAPVAAEAPQDFEDKDRTYIAPRVIPAAAVPEKADGAKIVLNIPDARTDRAPPAPPLKQRSVEPGVQLQSSVAGDKPAVAEVRARRRAPTVKIARPNLSALSPADSIDVALDDELEPPPPLEAPTDDVDGGSAAPLTAAKGLVQAVPIGVAPSSALQSRSPASLPVPGSKRISGPAHEAPATAIAIHETRQEKSRLPWVLFGALTLGAAAAGVFVATRKPEAGFASKAPAAQQTSVASIATATATTPASVETVAATATAEPTASVADIGSSTASATTTAQATQLAVGPPPRPVVTYPRPTAPAYTAPRPTATFPRPVVKKTSDIPSGI